MAITIKTIGNALQYTIRVTGWQTGAELASEAFSFTPRASVIILSWMRYCNSMYCRLRQKMGGK